MIKPVSAALAILASGTAAAEESRQLDAHEHGVGQLDIAFDGKQIAIELHAPGADVVGFEYVAESAEDRAAVDAAVATLARPLDLFALPASAGCSVVQASASLESEEEHEDHADHGDEAHDHEEHADNGPGDEDHAHEDHTEEAGHTEFHAEYLLNCADPAEATLITFAYFDTFPNALELEVQVITDQGATAFEVERDAPTLDLRDMF
ncbi:MAG: zinc uptake protein ZrgA [Sulfitobacter sp.]